MKKRFLLADDHSLVLDGIRGLIEPEHEVVGVAKNGRELVAAAEKLRPDVIILDISMPLLNGLEALRQLQRIGLHSKCIVVTMHASVEFAVDAIRLGASGFVLKADASSELQDALREIFAGRLFVTPSMDDDVHAALAERAARSKGENDATVVLTQREREVLQLIAEGRKIKEIAGILHISPRTAENHKYNIKEKLKLKSTAELTQYAIGQGFVQPLDPLR